MPPLKSRTGRPVIEIAPFAPAASGGPAECAAELEHSVDYYSAGDGRVVSVGGERDTMARANDAVRISRDELVGRHPFGIVSGS